MSRRLGFAGIQMEVKPGDVNFERVRRRVEEVCSSHPGVDLILLSELSLFGKDLRWAQPIPSEFTRELCRLALSCGRWLVPGSIYERTAHGAYNTALVISPQGEVKARYRKMFPWRPWEKSLAGDEFCVFDIPGRARVGLCICYDQWFPEVARQLTWMGAEVILNPVMTTTPDRPLELILSQANAIANQVYFLSVNGLGEGGNGRSILVDPEGRVLRQAGAAEEVLIAELDLDLVTRVRDKGTLGLCQVWKAFGSGRRRFPVYGDSVSP